MPEKTNELSEEKKIDITKLIMDEALKLFKEEATDKDYDRKLGDILLKALKELKP